MGQYQYKGVGRDGKATSGTVAAGSADEVARLLRRQRIRVTAVEPAGQQRTFKLPFGIGNRTKVTQEEVSVFTRQFSVMIDAGLPLVQCLDILSKQADNKAVQRRARKHKKRDGGRRPTSRPPWRSTSRSSPPLYCNMISAGEAGGILDIILRRLANYIEKSVKLKRAVKSASIYPAVIITVACVVVLIILWKVIPTFATMFAGLGAQLPLPTRIVVMASNFVGAYMPFLIIGIIVGIYAGRKWYRTDTGELFIDSIVLKLPVFGLLTRKIAVARF